MTATLVLGGARSGKSAYAEKLAAQCAREVVYIATAHAGDEEMTRRIAHHRGSRPVEWLTVEEPLLLGDAIESHAGPGRVLVVDCLTLWLTNLMFSGGGEYPDVGEIPLPALFHEQRARLLEAIARAPGDIVLVSNEVGMGIVPWGAVSRCFADQAGRMNQAVAAACERAVLVVAGLPLTLKGVAC